MKKYFLAPLQNLALIVAWLYDDVVDNLDGHFDATVIAPEHVAAFIDLLNKHEKHVKYLNLKESLKYIQLMRRNLARDGYKYGEYQNDVEILQGREDHELEDIVFGFIPADKVPYFQNKELFGADVKQAFPSAAKDIETAGNCYAHGTYTACVFHLIRALEYPLRELARKLGVPPPKKNPRTPLELRTWGDIIDKIVFAINKRSNPRTRRQAELTEFYNKAADQFQFFKDAWRDVVMHTRNKPYGEGEARDLIKSVETFMRRLAPELKEQS